MTKSRPKILHLHSTFAAGGKEVRAVGLMNAFGRELDHTIVSGEPDQLAARSLIAKGVKVDFPDDFPSLTGLPTSNHQPTSSTNQPTYWHFSTLLASTS